MPMETNAYCKCMVNHTVSKGESGNHDSGSTLQGLMLEAAANKVLRDNENVVLCLIRPLSTGTTTSLRNAINRK